MPRPMKRVVTGHDADGNAVVVTAGPPPVIKELAHPAGTVFYELWNSSAMPVPIDNGPDPTLRALQLRPTVSGSVVRIVDIPPDTPEFLASGAAHMKDAFSEIGSAHSSTATQASPHPLMHRTESLDYGVVIEGEVTIVLDRGEEILRPGDVVIQRGTNHAWANRGDKVARMLFVLLDGRFAPEIPGSTAAAVAP